MLYLPDDGIAFLSDLLFINFHPYMGCGNPEGLVRIPEQVAALGSEAVAPGHGPVGTAADLEQMRQYVLDLMEVARQMVEAGEPEEAIDGKPIPAPHAGWLFASFFPLILGFLRERRQKESR